MKIQSVVCVIVIEGDEKRAGVCELEPEYAEELIETGSLLPCVYVVSTGKCSFLFLSQKFYIECNIFIMYKIQYFLCHMYAYVMHEVWFRFRFYNVAY